MADIFNYIQVGGIVIILLTTLVEVAPIKVNPIQWLGSRWNKSTIDKVSKIDKKLDEHIAQSYRTKIMGFQDELLAGQRHTLEQFSEVIDACDKYEAYCEANNVPNGKCKEAIDYIKRVYRKCQDTRDFIEVTNLCVEH